MNRFRKHRRWLLTVPLVLAPVWVYAQTTHPFSASFQSNTVISAATVNNTLLNLDDRVNALGTRLTKLDTGTGQGDVNDPALPFAVGGISTTGHGVYGSTTAAFPAAGIRAVSTTVNGTALNATATASGGSAIFAHSAGSVGVQGFGTGTTSIGVSGVANGSSGHAIDAICNGACASSATGFAGFFTGNVSVSGNITAAGTITPSDARLKKDISDAPYGLDQVLKLRPVTYKWKKANDDKTQIGLIAQEVQKVVPEVVLADGSGTLAINYPALLPVVIKAVQEQQEVVKRQQDRIERLERALERRGNPPSPMR
jgi:hypothetical protein